MLGAAPSPLLLDILPMRPPQRNDHISDKAGEFPLSPPLYLFYLLFQVARQQDINYGQKFAVTGLSLQWWRILAVIRRIENCSMKDLALYSAIDRTTLTRAVDRLVDEGLVERRSAPGDRRRVHVMLSANGEAVFSRAAQILLDGNAAMLAGIETDDVRTAARVLRQIVRNLVDDPLTAEKLLAYNRPGAKPK